jgi:prepilin-type processing-associated H-X9-DG protein
VRADKIRFCPSAMRFESEGALQPFAAWKTSEGTGYLQYYWDGSYGSNSWIYQASNYIAPGKLGNWQNSNVQNTEQIPLLADSMMFGGRPEAGPQRPYDAYPIVPNDPVNAGARGAFMKQFCINRHNGFINMLFMDCSVRPVGLKELWTLLWHREYEKCNLQTMCGNEGNPADWPWWMRKFKDY